MGGEHGRLRWLHPVLRLLPAGVHLHHHPQGLVPPQLSADPVQSVRQLGRVHRLQHRKVWNPLEQRLRLVRLQVAYEVPVDVLRGRRRLLDDLLHVVLPKVAVALVVRLQHHLQRLGLADRNQPGRLVAAPLRGRLDPPPHVLDPLRNAHLRRGCRRRGLLGPRLDAHPLSRTRLIRRRSRGGGPLSQPPLSLHDPCRSPPKRREVSPYDPSH
mmetsp:Transcript_1815/g.4960  ORF Transcript_1815/g.4960 Transcript_1815/m.4960 type:complete len:213 (+) Transcript_1815:1488-2126(+)